MKVILFMVLACFSLAASYATFKMRYGWYLMNEDARFLDVGFLIAASAIVVLWTLFPSRVAVAVVGAMIFVFPSVLKQETFASVDIPFAVLSLVPIALLVLTTHVRRIWIARTGVA